LTASSEQRFTASLSADVSSIAVSMHRRSDAITNHLDLPRNVLDLFSVGGRDAKGHDPHMPEPASRQIESAEVLEREVAQAIAACDNDIRGALRAALVANSFLLGEIEQLMLAVSRGFTRGQSPSRKASEMQDRWREISAGQLPEVE
jgi:hypothetical protein